LLLSDEPAWNARLLEPRHAHEREYWVQVERIPTAEALEQLAAGVLIQGRRTLHCRAWKLEPQPQTLPAPVAGFRQNAAELSAQDSSFLPKAATPQIPPRNPPIRFRKSVPDCWIGLELIEGKNRQVRRMTAAIGHPTLRLLRVRIGGLSLGSLPPGKWKILTPAEREFVAGV
jgi:23S rRNA pseudouridine2457 synthase